MERSIVISFSEEDMEYVSGLQQRLNQELRHYRVIDAPDSEIDPYPRVWIYPDQPGGVRFHPEIQARIAAALAVIAM